MAIKTQTLTIKVSPEDKELVKQLAAEEYQTVSSWLYERLIDNLTTDKMTVVETRE